MSEGESSIFFSPNTSVVAREEICQELHIDTEALSDKYLGLPALVGAKRSDCFKHFVERIRERIGVWMAKLLSMGGKELLLKAVAQSIHVFAMSVFNIPKGVCKDITDLIAQFWWGGDGYKKIMHWYAWWKICIQKKKWAWDLQTCTTLILLCYQSSVDV